tara:strand:- start:1164 stop:1577 length:414 start_codon:yes stop_codon:yes gene_type:complete
MKPTKQKFFAELNKRRPSKINLSLNEDASAIMDELYNFRVKVSEIFQQQNIVFDEEDRVNQMWRDLAERGEENLSEYYGVVSRAESFNQEIEAVASDLGINVNDIPYYSELQNNLNDTKEDEDGIVNGLRTWQDKSN